MLDFSERLVYAQSQPIKKEEENTMNFTSEERRAERKKIIGLIGRDAYRKMVFRKWTLRRIERQGKP
jgi:hypothetical protein